MRSKYLFLIIFMSQFCFGFKITRDKLRNDLVVLTSEAHKLPMVDIIFVVKAGSVYDPPGKEGLANLTAKMLLRGTTIHNGEELLERVEYLGASIDINTEEDYVRLSSRALSKDLPVLLEIISEYIMKPAFDNLEFKKLKNQVYSEILSQLDDPFYAGQVAFRRLLFGNHPLNHNPIGFDTTIKNIEVKDLKDFYNTYYAPNNSFIVLVGDFNSDSVISLIDKFFGNWNPKNLPEFSASLPDLKGKKAMLIKRDISQSYIFLGFSGPDINASDWIQTRIMNYILGGSGLTSRLATEIREKRGLAYSVYSFFDRFKYGGYFVAGVQTKKESTNEAVELIVKEMRRLQEGVSKEELERAKKYFIGHFPLDFDTYREMANFITKIEIEGLGLDYPERFEDMVSSVTLEDITSSARRYLHHDDFCLAIVGNIEEDAIKIEGIEWMK